MAKALTVEKVDACLVRTKINAVIIQVIGTVSSGGWSSPHLSPWIYITPPPDGIWSFDLVATPPSGVAATVISPIAANAVIPNPPPWLKGVRIHASANQREALLNDACLLKLDASIQPLWDGEFPWPDVFREMSGGCIINNG